MLLLLLLLVLDAVLCSGRGHPRITYHMGRVLGIHTALLSLIRVEEKVLHVSTGELGCVEAGWPRTVRLLHANWFDLLLVWARCLSVGGRGIVICVYRCWLCMLLRLDTSIVASRGSVLLPLRLLLIDLTILRRLFQRSDSLEVTLGRLDRGEVRQAGLLQKHLTNCEHFRLRAEVFARLRIFADVPAAYRRHFVSENRGCISLDYLALLTANTIEILTRFVL